jgi:myo-inositol-1(or 4)-monophosphatase
MTTITHDSIRDVDFDWLERTIRAAGQIALRHYQHISASRKHDNTLVTEADGEVERFLRRELGAAFPGDTLLGEELSVQDGSSNRVWALDPIDGTSAYAAGLPVWGVSVGLLVGGEPAAGAFFMPATGEYYWSDGDGAWMNGRPIHVDESGHADDETVLCVTSEAHRHYGVRFAGKTRAFGSSAAHICFVARGAAAAAMLGHLALWDVAGALPVLRAAGGDLAYLPGGDRPEDLLSWAGGRKSPRPLLAGPAWALDYFASRINLRYDPRSPRALRGRRPAHAAEAADERPD